MIDHLILKFLNVFQKQTENDFSLSKSPTEIKQINVHDLHYKLSGKICSTYIFSETLVYIYRRLKFSFKLIKIKLETTGLRNSLTRILVNQPRKFHSGRTVISRPNMAYPLLSRPVSRAYICTKN